MSPFPPMLVKIIRRSISSIPPATPRNLWILLASLVAIQNIAVFHTSQSASTTVFAVLIWGGCVICMEDKFEHLRPYPTHLSLLIGTITLLWVLARTAAIVHWDGLILLLAPISGLSLALIANPVKRLVEFRDPFLCLLLLPSFGLIMRILPEHPISVLTAKLSGIWLSLVGFTVLVEGRNVYLEGGGVQVLGACNGVDMMAQIVCVSVIFLLAFPIRSVAARIFLLVSAPLIGLLCNTFRIAFLAYLVASGHGKGAQLFDFFHTDGGSLIFSGIAMFIFGYLYLRLLDRELLPVDTQQLEK